MSDERVRPRRHQLVVPQDGEFKGKELSQRLIRPQSNTHPTQAQQAPDKRQQVERDPLRTGTGNKVVCGRDDEPHEHRDDLVGCRGERKELWVWSDCLEGSSRQHTTARGWSKPLQAFSSLDTSLRSFALGGGFGLAMHTWNAKVIATTAASLARALAALGEPMSRCDITGGKSW